MLLSSRRHPGMEVRTRERGWALSHPLHVVADGFRCRRITFSESASVASMISAAAIQERRRSAPRERKKMSAASLAAVRGAFFAVDRGQCAFPGGAYSCGGLRSGERISSTPGCVIRSPRHIRGLDEG